MVIEFVPSRKSILRYMFENCPTADAMLYNFSDAVLLNIWKQQIAMGIVQDKIIDTVGRGVMMWSEQPQEERKMEKKILGLTFYYDSTDANKKGKRLYDFNWFDWIKYVIRAYIKYARRDPNKFKQPEELNPFSPKYKGKEKK